MARGERPDFWGSKHESGAGTDDAQITDRPMNNSPTLRARADLPGDALPDQLGMLPAGCPTRSRGTLVQMSCRVALPLFALLALGCQDPTQVRIQVRTDVAYETGRMLSFTATSPQDLEGAEPNTVVDHPWGPSGDVGTLVVVPEDDRDAKLAIQVVMGVTRDPSECSSKQPDGCIIARRRLQFLEHKTLEMPVGLHAVCEGEPCDENSTCNALGRCVPADIDPSKCSTPGSPECMPEGDSLPSGVDLDGGSDAEDAGQQTLVAHYGCDEELPGALKDSSQAMLDGTCEAGRCPGRATGMHGTACDFDGIDDAVVLSLDMVAVPFSITFWAQVDDTSRGTMMAKPFGASLFSWAAWLDTGGDDHFYRATSNDGTSDTGGGKTLVCNPCRTTPTLCTSCSHTSETWYFAHIKWDGSMIYMTFSDDPTRPHGATGWAAPGALFDDSPASLGAIFRDGGYSSFFDGRLDEIRFHNRVLTDEEIEQIVTNDLGARTASAPL